MRTYAGHSTAEASNELYRRNLAKGQTGLSVAFDLPTQTGYDPDHVLARGEVGRVGVPVAHLGDMRRLFTDIPLEQMNTSMTINATAMWLLAMYQVVAEEQGADVAQLQGTTQNDIVKEYLSRGTHVFPPGPSLRLTTDMIAYTVNNIPKWNPINICSYHLQEAGGPLRYRRSRTRCPPRSPSWTRCSHPGRCPRTARARSSPGSPSSSTPECASSRRCARCGPSAASGTTSPVSATASRTPSTAASATASRSTPWA
ncbi:hypothetical protein GCM10020000_15450 [Streptomyces olivoverticillatus]